MRTPPLRLDDSAAVELLLSRSRRRRRAVPWAFVLGACAVVVVLAGVFGVLAAGRTGSADENSENIRDSNIATLSCPPRRDSTVTVGNGPGSTQSGAEAILGFQHAFYVSRSGAEARSFVASDATNVSEAETIQLAIDAVIPVGTAYCVWIGQLAPAVFDVDLAEHRPDGTTTIYQQRVTIVDREGKYLIHSVEDR